jgi:exodeoxyribonuclease-3
MQEEIDGMNHFVENGMVDTFRALNPAVAKYSWWSYRAGAREKNVGWRIDYVMVSHTLIPLLKNARVHNNVIGSDHCPVSIEINLE